MRHGSLFSGIGGFDLAAEWMGWENKFHCENNPFCKQVLKYYWPDAESYDDIKTTDFSECNGLIDVVSGGFPCQPYSTAGKRKGTEDDRHLWPEMLRAVREIQPSYVVGENVRGLTNWSRGLVFDQVQSDLETEGYEVLPFLLPACAVNAPHRRDRIWFIAHARHNIHHERQFKEGQQYDGGEQAWGEFASLGSGKNATNAERFRQQRSRRPQGCSSSKENKNWKASWTDADGGWPNEQPVCLRDDGIPTGLADYSIPKTDWYVGSMKGAGNAIVPQVVFEIFKAIESYETSSKNRPESE